MKPNQLFTSMLAVTALFVASCSAPKMAQNNTVQDDVYNTTAQAKEYKPAASVQTQTDNSDSNADYYGKTDPNYDMDYSSRIDRFYYGNQWRGYYDPYYNYYGYNSFYDPFWGGGGLGMYYGSYFNNPFNRWGWGGFYGGWGFDPYWGMYSNYNYFGTGFYGGGWGGGYYGGGYYAGRNNNNPNYGARPDRGGENGYNRARGSYGNGANGVPSRSNSYGSPNNNGTVTRSRAESYNPVTNGGTTSRPTNGTGSRPTSTESSRPTRGDAPSRPSYSPPPQQSSPPPSSSGGGSRSSGGSSGGSSSSGGGRPGRG